MYKITKKITKNIVKKLGHESVFTLSSEEICIYGAYRLISIIDEHEVSHIDEVKYRLCEIGPGRRRFDPLMLDIILASKFFRDNVYNQYLLRVENWFFREGSASEMKIKQIKEEIISRVYEATSSEKLFEVLENKACAIIQECGYSILDRVVHREGRYLQFELDHEDKRKLLLRIYNSIEWIYPNSWRIWELAQTATKKDCIPVFIAPRIHGSCFQLFKAMGMLARTNYYLFAERDIEEIQDGIIKNEIMDIGLSLGKITSPTGMAFRDSFMIAGHLLLNIVPGHYEGAYARLIKNSDKINTVLNNNLGFSFRPNAAESNVVEKIEGIKAVVSMKLGHLNAVKDMVKRNENLIKELEYNEKCRHAQACGNF